MYTYNDLYSISLQYKFVIHQQINYVENVLSFKESHTGCKKKGEAISITLYMAFCIIE